MYIEMVNDFFGATDQLLLQFAISAAITKLKFIAYLSINSFMLSKRCSKYSVRLRFGRFLKVAVGFYGFIWSVVCGGLGASGVGEKLPFRTNRIRGRTTA